MSLIQLTRRLRDAADRLRFAQPVTHVYNPLRYACRPHELYLERYGRRPGRIVLVGMNPGPYGMAQTGVPFGDPVLVRDWLGIEARVDPPRVEHPKRPVRGFASERREVSGQRVWGWARDRFGTADSFFEQFFVANYCPLCFLEASGRNRTPDKLRRSERDALEAVCDAALGELIDLLRPRAVLGVGKFAESRVGAAAAGRDVSTGGVLHPSPASPRANQGWAERAEQDLGRLGLWPP
jgi:single-strand selective monofunctional uracil DNA glycosylase